MGNTRRWSLIECFDSSNDECMEFSRQQLHINITLLDVLIFSMDFFIRNDIEAKKTAKDIEEKKQTVEVAKTLRQKIVSMLLPDPWFGESADIQRATYSCYEMINGWMQIKYVCTRKNIILKNR